MCAASKAIFDLDKDGGCDFDGDDSGSYSRDAVSTDLCLFFFLFFENFGVDPPPLYFQAETVTNYDDVKCTKGLRLCASERRCHAKMF